MKLLFSKSILVTLANESRCSLRLPTKNLVLERGDEQTNRPMRWTENSHLSAALVVQSMQKL